MTADSQTPVPAAPARTKPKSARRRSREFALQGLYQWLLNREDPGVVDAHVRELADFAKCDRTHYDTLLHGCVAEAAVLDAAIGQHVDRKLSELSPVEHAALYIGAYELSHCLDIPYKVVINEAVELTKVFGGTMATSTSTAYWTRPPPSFARPKWPPVAPHRVLEGRGLAAAYSPISRSLR